MQTELFKCEYCGKGFKRESTLAVHVCERKRRYLQQDDRNVRLGYRAYQLFYRIGTNSKKPKTYDDFAGSQYYSAFVKFGTYCVDLKIDDVEGYTTWLLNNSVKLDKWTSDQNFNKWNKERLKRESVDRAVERSVMFMTEWAEQKKMHWSEYWDKTSTNQIVFHICAGRISPWVIYNSKSAQAMLDRLNQEQINMIIDYIDPGYWQQKLKLNPDDATWVENVIEGNLT